MITTICLFILIYSILKRPIGAFVDLLKNVDWKGLTQNAWDKIVLYSKRCGREATRTVLLFYYVMRDGDLSPIEKALVYAGIIYIAVPGDLLPRKVLGWIGVLDDIGVAAWIYKIIEDGVTPSIELMTEETLNEWFGPEIETGFVADLGNDINR